MKFIRSPLLGDSVTKEPFGIAMGEKGEEKLMECTFPLVQKSQTIEYSYGQREIAKREKTREQKRKH